MTEQSIEGIRLLKNFVNKLFSVFLPNTYNLNIRWQNKDAKKIKIFIILLKMLKLRVIKTPKDIRWSVWAAVSLFWKYREFLKTQFDFAS